MDILKLCAQERDASGFTHKIKITHADLTEATVNTAQAFTLLARPAGSFIEKLVTRLTTAFEDASDAAFNSCAITIGDGTTADQFLASQEINKNGTEVFAKVGQNLSAVVNAASTAGTLVLTVNSMAAKALADIDAGELHIFVALRDLDNII